MSGLVKDRARAVGFLASSLFLTQAALAQEVDATLPPVVVTATRTPISAARVGSAITVIDAAEIERSGATGLKDVLQSVPGLYVHDSGGFGSVTQTALRGSSPGETLVLLDGVRIGDPTGIDGSLDFGGIAVTDIDRIEVLRGPQSALYGSDAMGGVINIITRKGKRDPVRSVTIEGGSYGTLHTRASVSGATDQLSYAFSVDALHSDGFPRYGYRIGHPIFLGDGLTPLPPLPSDDPTNRGGVSGRISYKVSDDVEVEAGFAGYGNFIRFDNPFAFTPSNVFSPYNRSQQLMGQIYGTVRANTFDGKLANRLTIFGSTIGRSVDETESCPDFSSNCRTNFYGTRIGAEYQGDLKVGTLGLLTFGARTETEGAFNSIDYPFDYSGTTQANTAMHQTTNSVFAQQQVTLGDRIDISFGGRIDAVQGGPTFGTWRTTAAYRITETGTKLRASVGTGAKEPTLFQRFSTSGNATLTAEESVGVDAGIDQALFNDRLKLSGTAFLNNYHNLIGFQSLGCAPWQIFGCYFNVGKAQTKGLEFSGEAVIVPDAWRARASYTYMDAINQIDNTGLLQRPRNKAVASLIFSGIAKLEIEGRVTLVGERLDFGTVSAVQLSPYARFDLFANYHVTKNIDVFARMENLTNASYEEAYNFGVPGRSVYGGVKVTW